jgi:hypothetical protein
MEMMERKIKQNWAEARPDELLSEIQQLNEKLKKKTEDLSRSRFRLRKAKMEITRLREIIAYQRSRIVELHE